MHADFLFDVSQLSFLWFKPATLCTITADLNNKSITDFFIRKPAVASEESAIGPSAGEQMAQKTEVPTSFDGGCDLSFAVELNRENCG